MGRAVWNWLSRRVPANPRLPRAKRRQLRVEALESRDLPSFMAYPTIVPFHVVGGAAPLGSPGPTGYSPAQLRHAYGFDKITFNNGAVAGDGSGTTIAIVDAYNDPNIANDLHQFDVAFGLADPVFNKYDQNGGTSYPAADSGWITEIALDVEWAHAIAPKATIDLFEANSASFSDLLTAVQTAAKTTGVDVVSMSWGGGEFSGENTYDSFFVTPSGHNGVTFVAASGDSGAPPIYPSVSVNVLSVGGTSLPGLDTAGDYTSETGWSGSGGGLSAGTTAQGFESQPSYQKGVVTQSSTVRANPDVSYDADPNTGFPVYDSYNNGTSAPWGQWGGTSDAAPQWSALLAIADQGRALVGLSSLDGPSQTLPKLYALSAGDFHDITSGSSTGFPTYSAGTGYDLVTGRGTPIANLVVSDLVGQSSTAATHFGVVAAPSSGTAGTSFNFTVTALNNSGNTDTGYTGTVHFSSTDAAAILPANYTFTSADFGVHTFAVTLKTAGNETVTATDTSTSSITGSSASVLVSPAAASKLAFGQQPINAVVNQAISPAVTVRVLDAFGNLETGDNTHTVTMTIGTNPSSGTLGGTTTVTVSGGVATFSTLSINQVGNGYTLTSSSGSLTGATSASFNITAPVTTHYSVSAPASSMAGASFSLTVTALDASGHVVPGYTGTVHFSSSDANATLPADYTFISTDMGSHTFSVTLKTAGSQAGSQTVTASDTSSSSISGSASVSVTPAAASKLAFGQQPSNAVVNKAISPAVTVRVLDAFGNLETADNSDQVTLAIGPNSPSGLLSGTNPVTVSSGVATFSTLSINQVGNGYTLTSSSGSLTGATSASFNITSASRLIEGFETSDSWNIVGNRYITAARVTFAAHDGTYGLDQFNNNEWIYRSDAAAQVQAGDTISVWLQFAGSADGRAYFAFGATSTGTLSLVAAPNTGQLIIQSNPGYGFSELASVSQSYLANHWYRLEVDWGTSGKIVAKLFDSNGTTQLNSVTATTTAITSGGIGFRSIGSNKYWDTVTDTSGVNNFAAPSPSGTGSGVGGSQFDQAGSLGGNRHGSSADTGSGLASLAIALANAAAPSSGPASEVLPQGVTQPTSSVAVVANVAPVAITSVATSVSLGADAPAAVEATGIVLTDDNKVIVPTAPVDSGTPDGVILPVGPASQDSAAPEAPFLDELYDAAGTDERWTAAFADSDSLPTTSRLDEAGAYDVTTSLAIALGGVWIALAGKPDHRKRPGLAR
jgi:hypothetical protein